MLKRLLFLSLFFLFAFISYAYNLRKSPGCHLMGKSVLSISQDSRGLIWIGTSTGAYTYNGKKATSQTDIKGVKNIHITAEDNRFIESLYGLKYLQGKTYPKLNNSKFSDSDTKGNFYVLQDNNVIYCKLYDKEAFKEVRVNNFMIDDVMLFFVDDTDILRIVTQNGILRSFSLTHSSESITLSEIAEIKLASDIVFSFYDKDQLYFIDRQYALHEYIVSANRTSMLLDLGALTGMGNITSAVVFKDEFYFGTETGLFVVVDDEVSQIMTNKKVNCIHKDKFQELIWIGTDTDGLYTYSYESYVIKNYYTSSLGANITRPMNAIYYDAQKTLWLGTAGDGLVKIPNFSTRKGISKAPISHIKKELPDNTTHALFKTEAGMWIGCESGLAFYVDKLNATKRIEPENKYLQHIKAIYQQDSMLWLACYEIGIVKAKVTFRNNIPNIEFIKLFTIDQGKPSRNRFSSITADEGKLWFVNKSNGIYRIENDSLIEYKLTDDTQLAINKIKVVSKDKYLTATDWGTTLFTATSNNTVSILNKTGTRDILWGDHNEYWLSSDKGLLVYNAELNSFQFLDNSYGLTDIEYLPNSSFKDEAGNMLFFGGINGFTTIQYTNDPIKAEYMPSLKLEELSLYGIERSIDDFRKGYTKELFFDHDQNFFSLTFEALDYLNGTNYTYYYKIGEGGQWIDNQNSGTIFFTDISPGKYELFVKYYNKTLNKESEIQKLSIRILHPWYQSVYAYSAYSLLLLSIMGLVIWLGRKRKLKQKEAERLKAEQQRKEEIYEAKLDFFTDIAHEFATPLTLISGPCSCILKQKKLDPSLAKYINVMSLNVKRMNSLIADLMDFKQIDSGYKQPQVKQINVSEMADAIIDSFKSASNIEKCYDKNIFWNSDEKFLTTILINLLSNAVKYSEGETIEFRLNIEADKLIINMLNKSRSIREEVLKNIFDRYTIFNKQKDEDWSQNGLGLAITAGMVELLSGSIKVNILPNNLVSFTVDLPSIEENSNNGLDIFQLADSEKLDRYRRLERTT